MASATLSIFAIAMSSAAGPAAAELDGDAAGDATGPVDGISEGAAAELAGVVAGPAAAAGQDRRHREAREDRAVRHESSSTPLPP